MLVKDKSLKKIKYIFLIILVFFFSESVFAKNIKEKLLNYNETLKNSSALFIQTDGKTLEEGVVYIGIKRIKIVYNKPSHITIVLTQKKGMYINHELKETQYFNTNKSFVKIFFKILSESDFYEKSELNIFNNSIVVENVFEINDVVYETKIIYENEPIKLRKIKFVENNEIFEIGFFNHNSLETFKKGFFSLINPYHTN